MPDYNDYRSLMADGERAWHGGEDVVRYAFINRDVPDYYQSGFGWDVDGIFFSSAAQLAPDARERAMMQTAIDRWNEVANINMVEGGGAEADIVVGSADFQDPGLYGFAYYPDQFDLGIFPSFSGDIWINRGHDDQYKSGVGPVFGHTSWHTYLHELGHALGLSHPNDAPNDRDTNAQYTVLSYIEHPSQEFHSLNNTAWPITPMVWDLQAIQDLYGANTETRNEATVYLGDGRGFDATAERAFQYGDSDLKVEGEDGQLRDAIFTIWDGGGRDLLDASDFAEDARIDLRAGRYSSIGGLEDNIAVAASVRSDGRVVNFIEDAWGGRGDDQIIGNAGRNTLLGQGGADTLNGRGGSDTLSGGNGSDRLVGQGGRDVLQGGRHQDTLSGGSGQDRLSGDSGGDALYGGSGADVLLGGGGRDLLQGGTGRDILNGGSGSDRMRGGADADIFVFTRGQDRALDFRDGDRIDLRRARGIEDFDDLRDAHLDDTRAGASIEDARGHSLLLVGVDVDQLSADDFIF